jgi:2'-5' RNA ligase
MRYAIYYCPVAGSPLDTFGREWLAESPNAIDVPGVSAERRHRLLADVRRYGWHATLRAPFSLAPGVAYDDLHQAVAALTQSFHAFMLPLKLDALNGFLALRPCGESAAVDALADACLHALEPLREPLSDAAMQRRAAGLDATEFAQLQQFGYPYVLDRYRFHMTLSAPATEAEEQAMRDWLRLRAQHAAATRIDALTICREKTPGDRFEQIVQLRLRTEHAA